MRKSPPTKVSPGRRLEQRIRKRLGIDAYDSLTAKERHSLKQHFKLLVLYAGEFVAFRDRWEGEEDSLYLKEREVLCHSRRQKVVLEFIANLPPEEGQGVYMEFVDISSKLR